MLSEDIVHEMAKDIAYIKAKIEALPDHESRLRVLERFRYAIPSTAVLSLLVAGAALLLGFIQ